MPLQSGEYTLSPAQYRTIKRTAVNVISEMTVGRMLLPLDTEVGPGTQQVERTKYKKPENVSRVIAKGGEYDTFEPTEEVYRCNIHKIGAAFEVNDEDLESSRVNGRGLDKTAIQMASEMIAENEDYYIFQGNAKLKEKGLLDLADDINQEVVAEDYWDTGSPEIYEDFRKAKQMLTAAKRQAKVAIFNNADFDYLFKEDVYGSTFFKKLVDNFDIPKNNYLSSFGMPSGKVLLADIGEQIADFKEPLRVAPKDPLVLPNDKLRINVRERIGKEVYRPEAYAVIKGIIDPSP